MNIQLTHSPFLSETPLDFPYEEHVVDIFEASQWSLLNPELLENISCNLDLENLKAAKLVCRTWKRVLDNPHISAMVQDNRVLVAPCQNDLDHYISQNITTIDAKRRALASHIGNKAQQIHREMQRYPIVNFSICCRSLNDFCKVSKVALNSIGRSLFFNRPFSTIINIAVLALIIQGFEELDSTLRKIIEEECTRLFSITNECYLQVKDLDPTEQYNLMVKKDYYALQQFWAQIKLKDELPNQFKLFISFPIVNQLFNMGHSALLQRVMYPFREGDCRASRISANLLALQQGAIASFACISTQPLYGWADSITSVRDQYLGSSIGLLYLLSIVNGCHGVFYYRIKKVKNIASRAFQAISVCFKKSAYNYSDKLRFEH